MPPSVICAAAPTSFVVISTTDGRGQNTGYAASCGPVITAATSATVHGTPCLSAVRLNVNVVAGGTAGAGPAVGTSVTCRFS